MTTSPRAAACASPTATRIRKSQTAVADAMMVAVIRSRYPLLRPPNIVRAVTTDADGGCRGSTRMRTFVRDLSGLPYMRFRPAVLAGLVLLAGGRKQKAAFALAELLSRRGPERSMRDTCRVGARSVRLTPRCPRPSSVNQPTRSATASVQTRATPASRLRPYTGALRRPRGDGWAAFSGPPRSSSLSSSSCSPSSSPWGCDALSRSSHFPARPSGSSTLK